jgi:hypothetical protein
MLFSRILLGITGLAFAGYGLFCAYDLNIVLRTTGLAFLEPSAAVESRAMYGGLQTGLGLLWLNSAVNKRMTPYGLVAMVFVVGCLALGRALGIWNDGIDDYNRGALIFESASAVLAAIALWRERASRTSPLFE